MPACELGPFAFVAVDSGVDDMTAVKDKGRGRGRGREGGGEGVGRDGEFVILTVSVGQRVPEYTLTRDVIYM